jgi:general secretion pathway protein J
MTGIPPSAHAGFTLVELLVALTLFALMGSVLFGSLRLAGRSWDGGEAKVAQVSEMRQTQTFLRSQLEGAYPKHMRKMQDFPVLFTGSAEEIRYMAPLPERVVEGGIMYFRLGFRQDGDSGQLVLDRVLPDADAMQLPEFDSTDSSTVLADGVTGLKIAYFGREPGAMETETPTWRDRWEDTQILPMLIRIDVTLRKGPPWPTLLVAPRQAPEAGCRIWDYTRLRCVRP